MPGSSAIRVKPSQNQWAVTVTTAKVQDFLAASFAWSAPHIHTHTKQTDRYTRTDIHQPYP